MSVVSSPRLSYTGFSVTPPLERSYAVLPNKAHLHEVKITVRSTESWNIPEANESPSSLYFHKMTIRVTEIMVKKLGGHALYDKRRSESRI